MRTGRRALPPSKNALSPHAAMRQTRCMGGVRSTEITANCKLTLLKRCHAAVSGWALTVYRQRLCGLPNRLNP